MKTFLAVLLFGLLAGSAVPGCDSSTAGTGDGDGSVSDDVCKKNPFDPKCGQSCITSTDCGPDLYCGASGTCRADCTPGGSECGPNNMCSANGRCAPECASVTVDLKLVLPTVVLLIDQSGSMTELFGGKSRWNAVKSALTDPVNGVVPSLQDKILFGASLYTSHGGFDGGACPILNTVKPALKNAVPIGKLLGDNEPDGDTPTGESLVATVEYLEALPPDAITALRLIVLATDGEPDTCEVPNPQTGQEESIQGAQSAFSSGVRTIILSVGRDVSGAHLQDMANAGAGLPIRGVQKAPYYVANDPQELQDSFKNIAEQARSCLFTLNGEVRPVEYAAFGDVRLNDAALPFNDPNGWRLVDPSTLEITGSSCETYLKNEEAILTAKFPCGAIWET